MLSTPETFYSTLILAVFVPFQNSTPPTLVPAGDSTHVPYIQGTNAVGVRRLSLIDNTRFKLYGEHIKFNPTHHFYHN